MTLHAVACLSCNAHNFASKGACFKCSGARPAGTGYTGTLHAQQHSHLPVCRQLGRSGMILNVDYVLNRLCDHCTVLYCTVLYYVRRGWVCWQRAEFASTRRLALHSLCHLLPSLLDRANPLRSLFVCLDQKYRKNRC